MTTLMIPISRGSELFQKKNYTF